MNIMGERLYLRDITVEDTSNIVKWRNSDIVRPNFLYQAEFTNESHMKWLETMVFTGKVRQFIVVEISTDTPIGSVYLRDIDLVSEKAEFGIFLGEEDKLNLGYGSEATKLLINYGFEEMKLQKIFLRVLSENKRAIESYKKVGFVKEGVFKKEVKLNGKFEDVIFMAVFNGEI